MEDLRNKKNQMQRHPEPSKTRSNQTKSKNVHLSSNRKQEKLKPKEQSRISLEKVNSQQQSLHNSSQNIKTSMPCTDDPLSKDKADIAYEDSASSSNQPTSTNRNVNYEPVEPPVEEMHEKLSRNEAEEFNSAGSMKKELKQEKKSGDIKLNTETPTKYSYAEIAGLNDNLRCKKISSSKNSQACEQSEKSCSISSGKVNMHNRTKKNKLKHKRENFILAPQPCTSKDEINAKQPFCGNILKDSINQKEQNESLDVAHCNQTEVDKRNGEEQSNKKVKENSINAEKLRNTIDAKHECKQMEDQSTERTFENDGAESLDTIAQNNYTLNKKNNDKDFPENPYNLSHGNVPVVPPCPNLVSSPQFHGSTSGTSSENYYGGTSYCVYQNELSNVRSHDQNLHLEENNSSRPCPENLSTSCSNYSNGSNVHNFHSDDSQKRPFLISWNNGGVTYFQHYSDFAPTSYPYVIYITGQNCAFSVQQENLYSLDTDSSYKNDFSEFEQDEAVLNT